MSALEQINPNADLISGNQALTINISAAKVLQDILKTNLGPKGTLKMYVKESFFDCARDELYMCFKVFL